MTTQAPAAIEQLYAEIHKRIPQSELSGIVGDSAHTYGYHLSWDDDPAGDYSKLVPRDQVGGTALAGYASALDVKLPSGPGSLMTVVSGRLHHAMRVRDPRVRGLREFGGTLDGTDTFAYDNAVHASEGLNTWDSSHLWHVHLSVFRQHCDDWSVLRHIPAVMAGDPMTVAQRARAFLVRTGHAASPWRIRRWKQQAVRTRDRQHRNGGGK